MLVQRVANASPAIGHVPYVCFHCQLTATCATPLSRRGFHATTSKSISRTRKLRNSTPVSTEPSSSDASADAPPLRSDSTISSREPAHVKLSAAKTIRERRARAKKQNPDVWRPLNNPEEWEVLRQRVKLSAEKTRRERRARAKNSAGNVAPHVARPPINSGELESGPGAETLTVNEVVERRERPKKIASSERAGRKRAIGRRLSKPSTEEPTLTSAVSKAALKELRRAGINLEEVEGSQTLEEALNPASKPTSTADLDEALDSNVTRIKTGDVKLTALDVECKPVPRLTYGLSRALFNPGVVELRDLHSRVFNFDPYLEKIVPVADFDFSTIKTFTTASKDPTLANVAKKFGKKYIGSSSSMTGLLKHFHYFLSSWREPYLKMMSSKFPLQEKASFTRIQRGPDAAFLRWKGGHYAVDSDKQYDDANILSMMGQYMEKLLTVDKDVFERHRVGNSHLLSEDERSTVDSYHYSTIGDFVMRSQLDAYDPRLPGTGMFDLKTRAVLPIRMSSKDYEWGTNYELQQHHGEWHSYEREYHDMIRATMLKYSLQVRMGRMDGIFVAYHNIARIFGFQYISLADMDLALHGQSDPCLGDQEFAFSLKMLNDLLNKSIERFPEQSLRLHIETRPGVKPFMYFFAEPVTEEEVDKIQNVNKEKIRLWERKILKLDSHEPKGAAANDESGPGASLKDDQNRMTTCDAAKDGSAAVTSTQTAELDNRSAKDDASVDQEPNKGPSESRPLFGAIITMENYVNDKHVSRPENLKPGRKWEVRYKVAEIEKSTRAWELYKACKKRRRELFSRPDTGDETPFYEKFLDRLKRVTEESRKWRGELDEKDRGRPIRMWNDEGDQADITPSKTSSGKGVFASILSSPSAAESLPTRIFATLKKWVGGGTPDVVNKPVSEVPPATTISERSSITSSSHSYVSSSPPVKQSKKESPSAPAQMILESIRSPLTAPSNKLQNTPKYATMAALLTASRKGGLDTDDLVKTASNVNRGNTAPKGNPRWMRMNDIKTKLGAAGRYVDGISQEMAVLKAEFMTHNLSIASDVAGSSGNKKYELWVKRFETRHAKLQYWHGEASAALMTDLTSLKERASWQVYFNALIEQRSAILDLCGKVRLEVEALQKERVQKQGVEEDVEELQKERVQVQNVEVGASPQEEPKQT